MSEVLSTLAKFSVKIENPMIRMISAPSGPRTGLRKMWSVIVAARVPLVSGAAGASSSVAGGERAMSGALLFRGAGGRSGGRAGDGGGHAGPAGRAPGA